MLVKQGNILFINIVFNELSASLPYILATGFSIVLFEQDQSGFAAAYLQHAILLGIGCAALFGSFCYRYITPYKMGIYALTFITLILLFFGLYGNFNAHLCTFILCILAFMTTIEQANSRAGIANLLNGLDAPFVLSIFRSLGVVCNVFAFLYVKFIIKVKGIKFLLLTAVCIYILRGILWKKFSLFTPSQPQGFTDNPHIMLKGLKEIMLHQGLLHINFFRIIQYISIIGYTIGLPIFIANIAQGNQKVNAQLHSYSESFMQVGEFISGIVGAYWLKKDRRILLHFLYASSIIVVTAAATAFYAMQPVVLYMTAFLYGIGMYLFRTAFITISYAFTNPSNCFHVILTGDALAKIYAYGIGMLMPLCLIFPSFCNILPPYILWISGSLLTLGLSTKITQMYTATLEPVK